MAISHSKWHSRFRNKQRDPAAGWKRFARRSILLLAALAVLCPSASPAQSVAEKGETAWKGGDGEWNDGSKWTEGIPDLTTRVLVGGKSHVTVPPGKYFAGNLNLGTMANDDASVTIKGELVLRREWAQISQNPGSKGEVVLESGALHCAAGLKIGFGKTTAGLENKGILRIRGGSFASKNLVLSGLGGLVSIEGSQASSIYLVDCLRTDNVAAYIGAPCLCTFSFTLDSHGVTPIMIESTQQKNPLILHKENGSDNRSELEIKLSAVPPRDDVTLIGSFLPPEGTFDGLPEGSEVKAEYAGQTYRWTLTYQGGKSKCDVVLKDARGFAADAPVTQCRPLPAPPKLLWANVALNKELPPKPKVPAFPGAEGFGSGAVGGRGGAILFVDNLNDAGPGSLREAVDAHGPRTVIFRVGGVIHLKSMLVATEPYLTIAGQTAPGDGIEIRDGELNIKNTHDVIVRYLRIRPGEGKNGDFYGNPIVIINGVNIMVDHCSCSWGTAQGLSVIALSDRITLQWCFITETLLNKKQLAFGSIAGGDRVTWHHNLYAHLRRRIPELTDITETDFRNNVIYDWLFNTASGSGEALNYVSNYLKPGPSTAPDTLWFYHDAFAMPDHSVYLSGNVIEGDARANEDNWSAVTWAPNVRSEKPFPTLPVVTESAKDAYEHVLAGAGAALPKRDLVDQRIVTEVRQRTGRVLKVVADAGGFQPFQNSSWDDAAKKSMPDLSVANQYPDKSGYTNLEKWMNSIK